jgi:hypothetical protein
MAYRGKYRPKNRDKYKGDADGVTYRSLWERNAFRWCDENKNVVWWNSEETVIPYRCKTDGRMHRYFVDLQIHFATGHTYLIEIKPKKETVEPRPRGTKSPRYITEVMTYVKNMSKWEAAEEYAAGRGMVFEVWTEDTLRSLGMKILK